MLRGWDRMGYPREVKRSGWRRARANGALVTFILKQVVALERVEVQPRCRGYSTKISAAGETHPACTSLIRRRLEGGTSPVARSKKTARIGRAGWRGRTRGLWLKEGMPHNEGFFIVFY